VTRASGRRAKASVYEVVPRLTQPRKELAIMAIIVLILFVELLLAILLPAPNMGAPIRRLLGIRQGERKASKG
jgi:hypothetical protein